MLTMNKLLIILLAFAAAGLSRAHAGEFDFDSQKQLTKPKIEAFLNRAVAHFGTLSFQSFSEAEFVRTKTFLLHTGAKFIHGGELSWGQSYPDHQYWDKCKFVLSALHATRGLQDVIVEGFVAEHIGPNADTTLIPPWLWKEMEEKGIAKTRKPSPRDQGNLHYFHYDNFFTQEWPHIDRWSKGQSVPDITQIETQLYFRYLIKEYIDAGFESIWLGGLKLVEANDSDCAALNEVCRFAKEYAAKNARRHAVLLTSHITGRSYKDHELLDYICYPSRVRYSETYSHGLEINPVGAGDLTQVLEDASDLPVLLEIDNYNCQTDNKCICSGGFDEITGFAYKNPKQRRDFLKQYYHDVRSWPNIWCNNRIFLCMPGRRGTCIPTSTGYRPLPNSFPYPQGQYSPYREHNGEEDTIAALFKERFRPPQAAPQTPRTETETPQSVRETFDGYAEGLLGGKGLWLKWDGQRSARVQSEFTAGNSKRAIEVSSSQAGGQVDNKLPLPPIHDGLCKIEFDVAYKGDLGQATTFMRMNVLNALPDAELRPGGVILGVYWGIPARVVYQGDQNWEILKSPISGRWYHLTLSIDLDALAVDVSVDNKSVAKQLPLRDCRSHSLGSLSLIGYEQGTNLSVYLDNLVIAPSIAVTQPAARKTFNP